MKKTILIILVFSLGRAYASDLDTLSPTPTGSWNFQSGSIFVGTPVLSTEAVNMRYATSTVAGLTISDTPADNEILKYDSGTGKVNWEEDTGGNGGGLTDEYFTMYASAGNGMVYTSSSAVLYPWGRWAEQYGQNQVVYGVDFKDLVTSSNAVQGLNIQGKFTNGVLVEYTLKTWDNSYDACAVQIMNYSVIFDSITLTGGTTSYVRTIP